MAKLLPIALDLNDVLLVPEYSDISSRSEVDLTTTIAPGVTLLTPIISAPMDTVTEYELASGLSELGGIGILHRYCSMETQAEWVQDLRYLQRQVGAAVGVTGDYFARAILLNEAGATLLVVDVAHGDHVLVTSAIKTLKKAVSCPIMVGNICTPSAALRLIEAGADSLRVGIGGGAACTTRLEAGTGYPQFSTVLEIRMALDREGINVPIISDGGIKFAGDIVKCLGAGATAVMLGRLLAGCLEAPGEVRMAKPDGTTYKQFRGMASAEAKASGNFNTNRVEGEATWVNYTGTLEQMITKLNDGIQSGLSYAGARGITEFYEKSRFVKCTPAVNHQSKLMR
jgi:IMP dehydrogenase